MELIKKDKSVEKRENTDPLRKVWIKLGAQVTDNA